MTDRDKLIKILKNWTKDSGHLNGLCELGDIADYIIENGVICPPCKVGDTVYYITGIGHNLVKPAKIKEIIIGKDGIKDLYVAGDGHNFEGSFDIFFLTREEAEKALDIKI